MYSLNLPRMFYDMADDHAIIIDSATGNYYMLNIIASKVFLYITRGATPGELSTVLSAGMMALGMLSAVPAMAEESAIPEDLIAADPIHDVDEAYGWPVLKEDN